MKLHRYSNWSDSLTSSIRGGSLDPRRKRERAEVGA